MEKSWYKLVVKPQRTQRTQRGVIVINFDLLVINSVNLVQDETNNT